MSYSGRTYPGVFRNQPRLMLFFFVLFSIISPVVYPGAWYPVNHAPTILAISPSNDSSLVEDEVIFRIDYDDQDGWNQLLQCQFSVSNSPGGFGLLAYYDPFSDKLYIRNDDNTAWVGGYALGSVNVLENSNARIDCAKSSRTTSFSTLSVYLAVTFKEAFAGAYDLYGFVYDSFGAASGWQKKGTWIVNSNTVDTTPPVISIAPVSSPTNQDVTLSYVVSDNVTPTDKIVVSGDSSPYAIEGAYNVALTAIDSAGNSSSDSVAFVIDKTPPDITITSPLDGETVSSPDIILKGIVDGQVFSEARTLANQGANIITKTAQDSAGNSASKSITVYLDLGLFIGPEGGQITSEDGSVTLIIPSGALSELTRIDIVSPKEDELQSSAPAEQILVKAAEFKPYGLTFNKPVQLIYHLNKAEVPGTAFQLGLYNPTTNKIEPTGQFSAVGADGYTVTFTLNHFSTYGALKGSASSGEPIGSGVKIPLPDMFTGAFSHSVPLTVVPGRKKIQPNLALTYRSSNPNSWLGVGFSLNPGYIVRSTRLGPPSYDDTEDAFYFVNDSGSTELTHLVDNLYQAKIESAFTKFYKEADDTWRAVEKNGMSLIFGASAGAKEAGSGGTFAWYVSEAADTNGNYVSYYYTQDQGKSYLDYIEYTGNKNTGASCSNRVEFYLEPRDDVSSTYISGQMITTAKRLSEIQVKQLGVLVWRYELEYEYSPDTQRSLLKSITQYAADGSAFPAQTFSYQISP